MRCCSSLLCSVIHFQSLKQASSQPHLLLSALLQIACSDLSCDRLGPQRAAGSLQNRLVRILYILQKTKYIYKIMTADHSN